MSIDRLHKRAVKLLILDLNIEMRNKGIEYNSPGYLPLFHKYNKKWLAYCANSRHTFPKPKKDAFKKYIDLCQ